jgi:hypothetical protein
MTHLDTSIRRYAESQKNGGYIEICNCHNPERFLRFHVKSKKYIGENGCTKEFVCAKLQINKHKIVLHVRNERIIKGNVTIERKDPKILKNPADQTLDQFF